MKNCKIVLFLFLFSLIGCSQKQSGTPLTFTPEEVRLKAYSQTGYCELLGLRLSKAIYGRDGRMNPCQFSDQLKMLTMASNVAMLVNSDQLKKIGFNEKEELYQVGSKTYGEFFESQMKEPLCDSVVFKNEPAPAFCSAFVVEKNGEKKILTAAHCLKGRKLDDIKVIFSINPSGIAYSPEDQEIDKQLVVAKSQIFSIKKSKYDSGPMNLDIALLSLDGEPEATGFPMNETGDLIEVGRDVLLIGHPVGLEVKIDLTGEIKEVNKDSPSNRKHYFESSVDAFAGNSGSPILDINNEEVVGVLVSGNGDFKKDWYKGCYEERKYSERYSSEYEKALRIDSVIETLDL